ncbi:MAG: hypothetical protein JXN64_16080 [Spirochaetes bacterium]|nr:hypothetical protein [Spirochaetota bacterium]
MEKNENYKYIKYNDFWQNSLQRLEGITKNLEQNFHKLEQKYYDFSKFYDEIITEIDILASIYSSHNNLKGIDYILKLKSVLAHYKKRYSREGIDFKIIHFLNSKINKLRELSIAEFPKMEHSYSVYKDIPDDKASTDPNVRRYNELKNTARYKWITYKRNGSWFITRFSKFQIIRQEESQLSDSHDSDEPCIKIKNNDTVLPVIDIFSKFQGNGKEQIELFLIVKLKSKLKCFAVKKLGKIILADGDFITPRLKPFAKSKLSSGRFRIFGKNHIYL